MLLQNNNFQRQQWLLLARARQELPRPWQRFVSLDDYACFQEHFSATNIRRIDVLGSNARRARASDKLNTPD
jgi:hypothetical protein